MTNKTRHTKAESRTETMQATRRTVIRSVGVAGLLTMGVGSASAQQNPAEQAQERARQQAEERRKARRRADQAREQLLANRAKAFENVKNNPKVPGFVKDKIDIKFPGSGDGDTGGGGGGDNGISG
jgi:hypothetical protein